jgi:hypothetical protein
MSVQAAGQAESSAPSESEQHVSRSVSQAARSPVRSSLQVAKHASRAAGSSCVVIRQSTLQLLNSPCAAQRQVRLATLHPLQDASAAVAVTNRKAAASAVNAAESKAFFPTLISRHLLVSLACARDSTPKA